MPGLMKPKSRGTVRLASADPACAAAGRSATTLPIRPTSMPMSPASSSAIAIGNGKGFDGVRKEQVSIPGRQQGADRRLYPRQCRDLFPLRRHLRDGPATSGARSTRRCACAASAQLRVVDASVMPEITCCNTHAPTIVAGGTGGRDRAGAWVSRRKRSRCEVSGWSLTVGGASRYIAAHDDDRRIAPRAAAVSTRHGRALIFVVPPDQGPRHRSPRKFSAELP